MAIKSEPRRVSIAEARHGLASLVHEVEAGDPVELTRRGSSVAVLVSARQWRMAGGRDVDFWSALSSFRRRVGRQDLAGPDDWLAGVRDRGPGREPPW